VSGQSLAQFRCPQCGFVSASNDDLEPEAFFRPWHVVHGRLAVRAYVASLGEEAHEWLLALYVDPGLQLLAVDTVARGEIDQVQLPIWHLISRGKALQAAGFILVHNHPSGIAKASESDIRATMKLSRLARDLDVPLLDHIIIADEGMSSVGYW